MLHDLIVATCGAIEKNATGVICTANQIALGGMEVDGGDEVVGFVEDSFEFHLSDVDGINLISGLCVGGIFRMNEGNSSESQLFVWARERK